MTDKTPRPVRSNDRLNQENWFLLHVIRPMIGKDAWGKALADLDPEDAALVLGRTTASASEDERRRVARAFWRIGLTVNPTWRQKLEDERTLLLGETLDPDFDGWEKFLPQDLDAESRQYVLGTPNRRIGFGLKFSQLKRTAWALHLIDQALDERDELNLIAPAEAK